MLNLDKDLKNLTLEQLLSEYGLADFTYIETSNFLEELENYRQKLHNQIKEKQNEQTSQSLGSSK
jgi:hypothetical protein